MVFDKDRARETCVGGVDKRVVLAGFFIGVRLQSLTVRCPSIEPMRERKGEESLVKD